MCEYLLVKKLVEKKLVGEKESKPRPAREAIVLIFRNKRNVQMEAQYPYRNHC